jgi:hypothetical protein
MSAPVDLAVSPGSAWLALAPHPVGPALRLRRAGPCLSLLLPRAAASGEEPARDGAAWHARPWLFGGAWSAEERHTWLVPLLAVPKGTDDLLGGLIGRGRSNPGFEREVSAALP